LGYPSPQFRQPGIRHRALGQSKDLGVVCHDLHMHVLGYHLTQQHPDKHLTTINVFNRKCKLTRRPCKMCVMTEGERKWGMHG